VWLVQTDIWHYQDVTEDPLAPISSTLSTTDVTSFWTPEGDSTMYYIKDTNLVSGATLADGSYTTFDTEAAFTDSASLMGYNHLIKGDYVIFVYPGTDECVLSILKPHQSGSEDFLVAQFGLGELIGCAIAYSYE
jgi:hypothetical protein